MPQPGCWSSCSAFGPARPCLFPSWGQDPALSSGPSSQGSHHYSLPGFLTSDWGPDSATRRERVAGREEGREYPSATGGEARHPLQGEKG